MENNSSKKIVYVTGCLGFIGYHITQRCLQEEYHVIGVDKETYASTHLDELQSLELYPNFKYIKSDINDLNFLYECDYIINTAAETHVDNSIVSSDVFLRSNVNGVHHLLNLIKDKHRFKMPVLLHFSTDEVYGDIVRGSHTEEDLLKPSNPYSATKAAADMLILAWARTYKVPYIIVRPTNNYGIGQYTEKFIPKSCKYLSLNRKIPLHERGLPKRTWLHVEDTADAVMHIMKSGSVNQIYNISGNHEEQNIKIARKIIQHFHGNDVDYEKYLDTDLVRPGQDVRYAINDQKLKKIGWEPTRSFNKELINIVEFYKNNFIW
jgi:dTDP-glucose 4,6-dehydratase